MKQEDISAFLAAYTAHWVEADYDLDDIFHPEGHLLTAGAVRPLSVSEAKAFTSAVKDNLGPVDLKILHWAEHEGHIFIEWEMTGRVKGKAVQWRGINRNKLKGPKSVEAVSYWDRNTLARQIDPGTEDIDFEKLIA